MRCSLLLHNIEPASGDVPDDVVAEMKEAFAAYGRALQAAGVLVAAEVLESSSSAVTVTARTGDVQVQDGPFAETKEALAGIFLIEVPDQDAALAWAERCPGAQYGVVEVRRAATSFVHDEWT